MNVAYDAFLKELSKGYWKYFLCFKTKPCRKAKKPLVAKRVLKQIKIKNDLYATFVKTKTSEALTEFIIFVN